MQGASPQRSQTADAFGSWRRRRDALRGRAAAMFAESVEAAGLTRLDAFAAALEFGIEAERRLRTWAPGSSRAAAGGRVGWLEDGSGLGVVLVNGWSLSGLVWPAEFLEAVSATRRVVRVDNRGTGRRRADRSLFTIADLAGDVRDVIRAAGLDRPTVLGFSLGGMIATELALRWPGDAGALVLVSARPPSPARVGGRPGILGRALTPPTTDRPLADQFRERWATVTAPGFADRDPQRLEEMASAALNPVTPRRTVLAQARAVGAWRAANRLRNLAVPCTIVHGALDPLSPPENSRRLAALIPDARYVQLDGVGHLAPQEAPARLAETVTAASDHVTKEHP
jgi:pimeloyl-ACP methyl ester carboxylesterase